MLYSVIAVVDGDVAGHNIGVGDLFIAIVVQDSVDVGVTSNRRASRSEGESVTVVVRVLTDPQYKGSGDPLGDHLGCQWLEKRIGSEITDWMTKRCIETNRLFRLAALLWNVCHAQSFLSCPAN